MFSLESINLSGNSVFNQGFDIKLYHDFDSKVKLSEISGLSKINVFVGPNNVGKSRFLRALSCVEPLEFKVPEVDIKDTFAKLKELKNLLNNIGDTDLADEVNFKDINILDAARKAQGKASSDAPTARLLPDFMAQLNFEATGYFGVQYFEKAQSLSAISEWLRNFRDQDYTTINRPYHRQSNTAVVIKSLLSQFADSIDALSKLAELDKLREVVPIRYYIPVLRTLNRFDENLDKNHPESFYEKRIRKQYFENIKAENLRIFTGQSFYQDVRNMLLGGQQERRNIKDFEDYLSSEFFYGSEVTLVPRVDSDVVYVKIGDDEEKPVYHLGDAIQQLIMLTFPIFEQLGKPALFFIEEPELHLHPSMQRKFMEVLQKTTDHHYFITTHSNHLLDITLDYKNISIYTFNKIRNEGAEAFLVRNVQCGDESILSLLGVQNSSVFLSNCTIWVEGITDRNYLRKYLELVSSELKDILSEADYQQFHIQEDLDYSFVEYSGGNIAHWSFSEPEMTAQSKLQAKRLSQRIFLIADLDGIHDKVDRKKYLKETLGDNFKLLTCREIENLLSPGTIFKVILHFERKKKKDFSLGEIRVSHEDYKFKYLGKYIDEIIFAANGLSRNREHTYADTSGTIYEKDSFFKWATKDMVFTDMTPTAVLLTKRIFRFILLNKGFTSQSLPEFLLDEDEPDVELDDVVV